MFTYANKKLNKMKTKSPFKKPVILTLLLGVSVTMLIIFSVTSCGARKMTARTQVVTAPPEPPPPPPVPPQNPATGQKEGDAYVVVDEMPVFKGGDEGLLKYIAQNTQYPKEAHEKGIQGRVIVKFMVKADGSVSDVSVIRGVDPLLDNESVGVVKSLPAFTPGKQNGVAVPVWYMVPITFTLKGEGPSRSPRFIINGNDTIYTYPTDMPTFPGGREALNKFISDNLKYDPKLKSLGVEGTVFVGFIVKKDGTLTDIKIEKGVSPALDAEALRVSRAMPAWVPGKNNGKAVMTKYTVPFEFIATPRPPVTSNGEVPFVVVEEMPMFPGGDSALLAYICKNTKYPEAAKEKGIEGRVIVRFCVTAVGGVDQISVLRGVSPELDKEAIRVVSSLPAFKPGKQGGKPVPVWYMVPITFSLGNKSPEAKSPSAPPPPPPPPPITSGYDEPPVFKGGEKAMYKFIESNINYPAAAKEKKISGKVKLIFCINTDGTIGDITVMNGIDPLLNEEAIRVVKSMPKWKPGKLCGNSC